MMFVEASFFIHSFVKQLQGLEFPPSPGYARKEETSTKINRAEHSFEYKGVNNLPQRARLRAKENLYFYPK
jgi:hypothetical protein